MSGSGHVFYISSFLFFFLFVALQFLQYWPIKKTHVQRLMVAEMRKIRWMCGYTRLDKIRNVEIKERVGVAYLEDKMRETRLRWFKHVKRSVVSASVRRCEAFDLLQYRRGRGRPKTSWNAVFRSDMKCLGVTKDIAQDRNMWRRIRIVDHTYRVW